MMADIQKLRYEVYCRERGFLDAKDFPEERESDAYDEASVHCAAVEGEGQVTGGLRLVLDSPLGFPLESRASGLDEAFHRIPRDRSAEISRLVVARHGRLLRHPAEFGSYPLILFRLFREMNLQSAELGLEYWLAAMEPTLHRLLRRLLGFAFVQVGKPMEYYGEVRPYMARIADVGERLEHQRPDLFVYFGFAELQARKTTSGSTLSALRTEMIEAERHIMTVSTKTAAMSSAGMTTVRPVSSMKRVVASVIASPAT
jgi:N-acyl amino acid synthase of PEP-CTERM/exosortase system